MSYIYSCQTCFVSFVKRNPLQREQIVQGGKQKQTAGNKRVPQSAWTTPHPPTSVLSKQWEYLPIKLLTATVSLFGLTTFSPAMAMTLLQRIMSGLYGFWRVTISPLENKIRAEGFMKCQKQHTKHASVKTISSIFSQLITMGELETSEEAHQPSKSSHYSLPLSNRGPNGSIKYTFVRIP